MSRLLLSIRRSLIWWGCEAKRVPARIHQLERSQRVELPVEQAFAFYGDALNLEPLTPPWLHFKLLTPLPITLRTGTLLDYTIRLHGVPVRWQTRIERWEAPTGFFDVQAKGPYKLWEHTHAFEPDGDGATIIHDRVRYALPLGPLGALAHRLFVRRDLERIFDYRRDAVAERVARPEAGPG
jgi:ligand-binding SRPBCC domain-containing protein